MLFIRTLTINRNLLRNSQCYLKQINQVQQRTFATTSTKNAIPPLVWLIAKPLTKLGAIIAGRGFRNWWVSLPKVKRTLFKDHLIRNKYRYILSAGTTVGGSVYYYDSHIHETPITHRKRFILFSTDQLGEIENLEKEEVSQTYYSFMFFIEKKFVNLI